MKSEITTRHSVAGFSAPRKELPSVQGHAQVKSLTPKPTGHLGEMQVDAQGNGAQGFHPEQQVGWCGGRPTRQDAVDGSALANEETKRILPTKIRGAHKLSVGSGPLHLAAVPRLPFQAFRLEGLSSCGARRN